MDVLKNKRYKSYDKLSRYTRIPYYYHLLDNKYIYGTAAQLDTTTTYTLHMVESGETPDSIALDFYNDPTFYWIILDFNRIQDPFAELPVGKYIKIPNISAISFDL